MFRKNVILGTATLAFLAVFTIPFLLSTTSGQPMSQLAVSLRLDRSTYSLGQTVNITGRVIQPANSTGVPGLVTISVKETGAVVYRVSVTANSSGYYADSGFRPGGLWSWGKTFSVDANATYRGLAASESAVAQIAPSGLDQGNTTIAIGVGVLVVLLLAILSNPNPETNTTQTIAFYLVQFVCLSIIAFIPTFLLLFSPAPIGTNAPIGMMIDQAPAPPHWVLNIGGANSNGDISGGIQIPIYVIVLGTLGAWIRYLYDTLPKLSELSSLGLVPGAKAKDQKDEVHLAELAQSLIDFPKSRLVTRFVESMKVLSFFFLAPLLATGLWLVLSQTVTNDLTLSVVVLMVGLLIEEVADGLKSLASGLIKRLKGDQNGGNGGGGGGLPQVGPAPPQPGGAVPAPAH